MCIYNIYMFVCRLSSSLKCQIYVKLDVEHFICSKSSLNQKSVYIHIYILNHKCKCIENFMKWRLMRGKTSFKHLKQNQENKAHNQIKYS